MESVNNVAEGNQSLQLICQIHLQIVKEVCVLITVSTEGPAEKPSNVDDESSSASSILCSINNA